VGKTKKQPKYREEKEVKEYLKSLKEAAPITYKLLKKALKEKK
jgi:hypothetical protein